MREFDFGHLGFLIPPNKKLFFEMLELCRLFNKEFTPLMYQEFWTLKEGDDMFEEAKEKVA